MINQFAYDVVFANAFADLDTARQIAKRLEEDGLRIWVNIWYPGQFKTSNPQEIERLESLLQEKLQGSRTQILVMSKSAFGSSWGALEKQTRLFRDPANPGRQFIPLRIDESGIPRTMSNFAYIDWRHPSEDEYERLLASCRSIDQRNEDVRAPIYTLVPHKDHAIDLLISKDEQYVYSATSKEIRTWKFADAQKVSSIRTHLTAPGSVAFLTDTFYAISDGSGVHLEVWDMQAGVRRDGFKLKAGIFKNFRMTADRRRIVSVQPEGFTVMNVVPGKLQSMNLESADLTAIELSGNGN